MFWEAIKEKAGPPFCDMGLPMIDAAPALLYLMRRFGFPNAGSDSGKEVCDYLLSTPRADVDLVIHVGATHAQMVLTVNEKTESLIHAQMLTEHGQRLWGDETEIGQACIEAGAAALRDLLRPVQIRDAWINILGKVELDDLGEWNEAEKRYKNTASPWPAAGYGVPEGCYEDPELFIRFMAFVKEVGGGDTVNGMTRVINQVTENAQC